MALKETFSDRTHWRNMLTSATLDEEALVEAKEEALDALGIAYEAFFEDSDVVTPLHYPVRAYPRK